MAETKPTISELQARIAELEAQNADLKNQQHTSDGLPADIAPMVREKMAAGLTREQAIQVARAQQEHDRQLGLTKQ